MKVLIASHSTGHLIRSIGIALYAAFMPSSCAARSLRPSLPAHQPRCYSSINGLSSLYSTLPVQKPFSGILLLILRTSIKSSQQSLSFIA